MKLEEYWVIYVGAGYERRRIMIGWHPYLAKDGKLLSFSSKELAGEWKHKERAPLLLQIKKFSNQEFWKTFSHLKENILLDPK
jgi:hypothetical protein